jgi:pyruvate dehydrogenase E2 component (dihydrolipoamide acetyltransferase)
LVYAKEEPVPDVVMPQLGETADEGTVTKWFKSVGDAVAQGDVLFEVATDKVEMEIAATADGVLTEILVPEGTTVDVGATLATIGARSPGADAQGGMAPPAEITLAPQTSSPKPRVTVSTTGEIRLTPKVRKMLRDLQLDPTFVVATGPHGRITPADVERTIAATSETIGAATAEPVVLSPIARRLLRERDLDPATIVATGEHGRLTRADIERTQPNATPGLATTSAAESIIPFTRIRKLTAEHMVSSKAISAHTLMVKEIDYEPVERVRRTHGDRFKADEGFSLTYLSFNACAVVEALQQFPYLNSSVRDEALIVHDGINLGIAVDLDNEGLVVPVIHGAQQFGLRQMAQRIRSAADRARSKKLTLDDVSSGTFSITNPGPFGTLITGAIINQPQVAILSTDAVVRKPVVLTANDGAESIAIRSIGMLALTFDHRAVDGAYVARFLTRVGDIIGTRDWAGEL